MIEADVERGGALTDPDYWASSWDTIRLPRTIDLSVPVMRELAERIRRYARLQPGALVLEVGCAASAWLPFFHEQWGWRVEGIDYTASGCASARQNLALLDVPGTIYEADVFDFADTHQGRYDLVMSYGVVEHFTDPVEILRAMYNLLGPNGRIVVIVPHLRGLGGLLQKVISPAIYRRHNPLLPSDLSRHLAAAGFEEIVSTYVGREPLMVLNHPTRDALPNRLFTGLVLVRQLLDRALALASKTLRLPPRWMATYVLACGTRPE